MRTPARPTPAARRRAAWLRVMAITHGASVRGTAVQRQAPGDPPGPAPSPRRWLAPPPPPGPPPPPSGRPRKYTNLQQQSSALAMTSASGLRQVLPVQTNTILRRPARFCRSASNIRIPRLQGQEQARAPAAGPAAAPAAARPSGRSRRWRGPCRRRPRPGRRLRPLQPPTGPRLRPGSTPRAHRCGWRWWRPAGRGTPATAHRSCGWSGTRTATVTPPAVDGRVQSASPPAAPARTAPASNVGRSPAAAPTSGRQDRLHRGQRTRQHHQRLVPRPALDGRDPAHRRGAVGPGVQSRQGVRRQQQDAAGRQQGATASSGVARRGSPSAAALGQSRGGSRPAPQPRADPSGPRCAPPAPRRCAPRRRRSATVATGTPGGICTMDSRASNPASGPRRPGTPITGLSVSEATTPGRWAAMPAAAMKISVPPRSASSSSWCTALRLPVRRGHLDAMASDRSARAGPASSRSRAGRCSLPSQDQHSRRGRFLLSHA